MAEMRWLCPSRLTDCRLSPQGLSAISFFMSWGGTRTRISTSARVGASNHCRSGAWIIRLTTGLIVLPERARAGSSDTILAGSAQWFWAKTLADALLLSEVQAAQNRV